MPQSTEVSLSETARYGRLGVIGFALAIATLIIGRAALTTAVNTYKALNPPPTPPPTVGFGYLQPPAFPAQFDEDRPETYSLETVGQRLPSFGTQAKVYFMPIAQPNLLALDRAKETAAALGFVFPPEKISDEVYRWRQSAPLPSTLEINVVTRTLELERDWATSVSLLEQRMIPNEGQLLLESRTLLRQADLLPPEIASAEAQISYMRALAGQLREVSSVSESDFVRADFFRSTPFGEPTVTSQKGHGIIRILFSGSRTQGERVLELISDYYPVDWANYETYPLQPVSLAWQSLQAGGGYVVTPPANSTEAVIRDVSYAYYEPASEQNYFQPVYVFDGDDGFRALVPALDPRVFTTQEP